jgi:hypothetical protein
LSSELSNHHWQTFQFLLQQVKLTDLEIKLGLQLLFLICQLLNLLALLF